MARTRSKPVDEKLVERLEEVGKRITAQMKGQMFEIEGTPQLAVLKPDGSYRVHPMVGGQEFFYHHAYVGKKGLLIFCFESADAQEYQHAEVDEKAIDNVFPLFASELAGKLGCPEESAEAVVAFVIAQIHAEKEAEKAAYLAAEQSITNHPLFGRF